MFVRGLQECNVREHAFAQRRRCSHRPWLNLDNEPTAKSKVSVRPLALTRGRRAVVMYAGFPDGDAVQYAVQGLPEGWRGYVARSRRRWKVLLIEPGGPVPEWTGDYPDVESALEGLRVYCDSRSSSQGDRSGPGADND